MEIGIGLEILISCRDFLVDGGAGFRGSASDPFALDCCIRRSCVSCRGSSANPMKYAVGRIYGAEGGSG
jgi:hypothetical protein